MKGAKYIFGLGICAILTLIVVSSGVAIEAPGIEYRTIETDHFYIHYHSGLDSFAERTAEVAEQSHAILSPRLDWSPQDKTHIVINDKSDSANGSAGVVGRNTIRINAMPPKPRGVLGYYNDWLRILIFHEYVHILHMDTKGGLAPWINTVIGKRAHPNQFLPRWYLEGIAIYYETKLTETGRLASSLWDGWIRTAALDDEFFTIDMFSGNPIDWPFGNAPYLYGSYFIDYITDKHGEEFIKNFNHRYGRRVLPFSMNLTASQVSGQTYHELWQEWDAHARGKALAERIRIEAEGRTPLRVVTDEAGNHRSPTLKSNGDYFSYLHSDLSSDTRFKLCSMNSLECNTVTRIDGAAGIHDWGPEGDKIVFSRQQVNQNVYRYHDLFVFDTENDTVQQLTTNKRIIDLDVSPGGERIAYVETTKGTTRLVLEGLPGFGQTPRKVLIGKEGNGQQGWTSQQISSPQFGPTGERLFFTWWSDETGQRDIWLYDLSASASDRLQQITRTEAQELDPFFDGEYLYFSSDRTGIFNIYRMDPVTGEVVQMTNVVSGLFEPRTDSELDGFVATSYSADGYEIVRIPKEVHQTNLKRVIPGNPGSEGLPQKSVQVQTDQDRPYRGFRWLKPLFFTPEMAVLTSGAGVGASISSYDPVGHHSYSLQAAWITDYGAASQATGVSFNYDYGGWPVDVSLNGRLRDYPRAQGLLRESRFVPFFEREYAGGLSLTYPFQTVSDALFMTAGFEARHTNLSGKPRTSPDPGDLEPSNPEQGWYNEVSFQLFYSNVEQYAFTVGPARGVSGHVRVSFQNDLTGSDFESTIFDYSLRWYQSTPWSDEHTVTLGISGGAARTNFRGGSGFAIGGYRPQDFFNSFLLQQNSGQLLLRGYPTNIMAGSHFQILNAEYRFPLLPFNQGLSTLPVFLRRLKGAVFADAGKAGGSTLSYRNFRPSLGAEMILETYLGFSRSSPFRVGYARGLHRSGINEWYLRYGSRF